MVLAMLLGAAAALPLRAADEIRDLQSDTWVATDALGRSLPTNAVVGGPRQGKFVGVFYFLWLGRHGEAGPYDISRILAKDPTAINDPNNPLWGHGMHHWGEPIFGYYISDDDGVLRKHAQMLADAGVDAIFFDVTNQFTYPESWKALCRVFDDMRRQGNRVPQIVFLCPFGTPGKVVHELWDQLYSKNLYPELWFRWEGKPLILADPALLGGQVMFTLHDTPAELRPGHTLGQTFKAEQAFSAAGGCFPNWNTRGAGVTLSLYRDGPGGERIATRAFADAGDNAWCMLPAPKAQPPGIYYLEASAPVGRIGWWTAARRKALGGVAMADGVAVAGGRNLQLELANGRDAQIREFFTFRKPQPDYFTGPTGPRQWGWLEVYPQHAFYKTPGVPEEVAVGVAQNAVDGKLGVLSNPRSHGRSFHDGAEPGKAGQDTSGRNFAEQWRRALQIDPSFVFITGWNEWIAGRYGSNASFHGAGPVTFVDEFDQEFSRDIEPMKGGHGDNYYYQMIANIRRYKGVRELPAVRARAITIDGKFDDWREVTPEFRDTVGDPVRRDYRGWGRTQHYRNQTGRNDIVAAKVSFDARSAFFYVQAKAPLTPRTDPNWMLLFIDADRNPATGWLGYDYVVNRAAAPEGRAILERNEGGAYRWTASREISCRVEGREMELAIPLGAMGISALPATVDFKWADNIRQTGDWSDFTLNGDVAPNDRYNYRARLGGGAE